MELGNQAFQAVQSEDVCVGVVGMGLAITCYVTIINGEQHNHLESRQLMYN